MATETKAWEIVDGRLKPLETSLANEGRKESLDLESWIATNPSIIRPGLTVIGRQVMTGSGPLDLLAIDRSGDLVIIELKRDRLPRETLAQAMDYASDVASWGIDKLSEVCTKYTGKSLEDVLSEHLPDMDLESFAVNESQRIILVGFAIEASLERMVEWLSDGYGVGINAVILKYVRTSSGDEVLTRTAIISEQTEEARVKSKKFTIAMSDAPGDYEEAQLEELLFQYLSKDLVTVRRIREVVLPACLAKDTVTREELKQALIEKDSIADLTKAGFALTVISGQIGMEKNDFLRQVINYEYPNYQWEKDNYSIRSGYRTLVERILTKLS